MLQTNMDITFCVIVDVLANGQWIDWTFGQPGGVTRPVWTHPVSLGTGSGQKDRGLMAQLFLEDTAKSKWA